jgi:hypothetical protein
VGSSNDNVRLRETDGNTVDRYITLSHCWGSQQPLTTTAATLNTRNMNISWESLPAVFQDAITVTRRLHIHFLWIDSLCILQDVKEDWVKESAKMGSIYEHSYPTIAAASSINSTVSFLFARRFRQKKGFRGLNLKFGDTVV